MHRRKMEIAAKIKLSGLFHLVRKEMKDVRKEIQELRASVASLNVVVSELQRNGSSGQTLRGPKEILGRLGRIEGLFDVEYEKPKPILKGSDVEEVEDEEYALSRPVLEEPTTGQVESSDPEVENAGPDTVALDVKPSAPKDRRLRIPRAKHVTFEPPLANSELRPTQSQDTRPTTLEVTEEKASDMPASKKSSGEISPQDKRFDALSSQIAQLVQGQAEIMGLLKGLAEQEATPTKNPVVVARPRKIRRKVVGFVYEDDSVKV
ncbi:uncharacterized protein RCC_08010 [Ramularia collo-cygni]|uniref:Uncharacterized protein n=1 Tax=Ramularia collo-cygni TaxID=112498 RepID=A0A2D3UZ03_9PEZI|nr:uncharacterized protein RCC_08010 [Ramularia collo-cygni]CZT22141.1 uncharacterized protein RCC_08010 [Ramularia collo-cygni]